MEYWMTRNITLAAICGVVAVVLVLVSGALDTNGLAETADNQSQFLSVILNVMGILFGAGVGYFISYDQVEKDISKKNASVVAENRKSLKDATAKSAAELNDLFNNMSYLESTWKNIAAKTAGIDEMLASSVANTLSNIKSIIQSTTNKIIYISSEPKVVKFSDNPYGLYNFQEAAICSNLDCGKKIEEVEAPHYPHGSTRVKCNHCGIVNYVKRGFDGSLRARADRYYTPISGATVSGSHDRSIKADENSNAALPLSPVFRTQTARLKFDVKCANVICDYTIHVDAPSYFTYANRGCPKCLSSMKISFDNRVAELFTNNYTKQVTLADIAGNDLACNCDAVVKTGFAQEIDLRKSASCIKCGAVYWAATLPPSLVT
jgi:hypothetical protein